MDYVSIHDLHGLVVIKDSVTADCSGAISGILKLCLSEGTSSPRCVLVVTSKHSTSHYSMVLRRLNLNVSRIAATGRFRVLNTNSLTSFNAQEDTVEYSMGNLLDALSKAVNELESTTRQQCIVLFDDITSLVSSCDSTGTPSLVIEQTVTGFCHLIGISCIVMVVHEDIKDMQSTVSSLSHTAATIVTVKPLSTGMSAEIEAQIEIYRRSIDTSQLHSSNVEQKQQHQRLGYCQHSLLRVSRS